MKRIVALLTLTAGLSFALALSAFSADGDALFKTCVPCHGTDGTKPPHPFKGKTADEVLTMLKGYAAGTYGGAQKAIMQSRAKMLSEDDMKALADHIAKL